MNEHNTLPPAIAFVSLTLGLVITASIAFHSDAPARVDNLLLLAGGLSLLAAGAYAIFDRFHTMGEAKRALGLALSGVVALSFTVGLASQEEVNGHPVLDLSSKGALLASYNSLADDLTIAHTIDVALTQDPVVIRAKAEGVDLLILQAETAAAELLTAEEDELSLTREATVDALLGASKALRLAYEAAVQSQEGRSEVSERAALEFAVDMRVAIAYFEDFAEVEGFTLRDWMKPTLLDTLEEES